MPDKLPKLKFSTKEHSQSFKNEFAPSKAAFYDKNPAFSFVHYQHHHKQYSAKHIIDYKDFHIMFERLQAMSQLKWKDIINTPQMYHCHPINWSKTPEVHGFNLLPPALNEAPPWQFKSFKECRIIGFFNQNSVFELVWIDRDHKACPRK